MVYRDEIRREVVKCKTNKIETIYEICRALGKDGRVILRQEVIQRAQQLEISESTIQLADYCSNKKTGRWSHHTFLFWIGRGKYTLIPDAEPFAVQSKTKLSLTMKNSSFEE